MGYENEFGEFLFHELLIFVCIHTSCFISYKCMENIVINEILNLINKDP